MGTPDCAVVGVGVIPFGRFFGDSLKALARRAIDEALRDADLGSERIEMAFVANAVGGVTTEQVSVVGQVVLGPAGISGIPVYNVDNACASSTSALSLAVQAIRAGAAEVVLVVGVEKLYHENRELTYRALNGAADMEWVHTTGVNIARESVFVKEVYPARLARYRDEFGLDPRTLARISVKNRRHAELNPNAQFRTPLTEEEVLAARIVTEPLTTLMCAPVSDGASAAVVVGREAARGRRPVWVRASLVSMGSAAVPRGMVATVAEKAYQAAGLGPSDVNVAEVHDATAFGELLACEDLGFCARGEGARLLASGATALGGALPVNPSGGLESRGHPIAATGLAQIAELVTQIRGEAGPRQVAGAHVALAETAGGFASGDTAAICVNVLSD